jgi:hypothetical protein
LFAASPNTVVPAPECSLFIENAFEFMSDKRFDIFTKGASVEDFLREIFGGCDRNGDLVYLCPVQASDHQATINGLNWELAGVFAASKPLFLKGNL